jgi:hypothetical protein
MIKHIECFLAVRRNGMEYHRPITVGDPPGHRDSCIKNQGSYGLSSERSSSEQDFEL